MSHEFLPTFSTWFRQCLGVAMSVSRKPGEPWITLAPRWKLATVWPGESSAAVQQSLTRILAVSHLERLNAAPLIRNLASEHRWSNRRRLRRLADRIESGLPIISALEQTPDAVSDQAVLAIRFGSQSGTLDHVYKDLLRSGEQQQSDSRVQGRMLKLYFFGMTFGVAIVLTFLFLKIIPVLKKMMLEWDAFQYSGLLTFDRLQKMGQYLLLVAILFMLFFLLFRSRRVQRYLSRDWALAFVPRIKQRRISEFINLMAIAVSTGRPISGVLSTLARYHFNRQLRLQLLFARNEIEQGAEPWGSLAKANLLRQVDASALQNATSNETKAWILRKLSEQKSELSQRGANRSVAFLHLFVVLLFATIVIAVSGTVFGYLSELVTVLSLER